VKAPSSKRRIEKALAARYPLVYVRCQEEERLENLLNQVSADHFGDARPLTVWTRTRGFTVGRKVVAPICDPLDALRHIRDSVAGGFYLMADLPAMFAECPSLIRGLRDLYDDLAGRDIFVFLSSARLEIPEALQHQMFVLEMGAPSEAEIVAALEGFAAEHGLAGRMDGDWMTQAASAMKGLMLNEVRHLMLRLVAEDRLDLVASLNEIHEEKAAALMREGCLKYIGKTVDIEQVGGLDNLKEWVLSRSGFFSSSGLAADVPLPSGVLFMGVSGCGKSMAAKVIASAWRLPLVRLDMNLVLSGAFGSPEYAFDHALRVAEQISPLVLWIDEMENSFGYDVATRGGGNNPNIFSSFLTWMQEKPAGVFVVATANRIEKLPAEVIRKGRFDQLFFLDLPSEEERASIFRIHLKAVGADPAAFNLKTLTVITKNWSGAEIEQAIRAAVVHAWQEQRPFTERDVLWSTTHTVPLSRTMEEQIKQLRLWSQERATPASRKPAA
jgi:ATP-dependent 26S proteasome regulatory subunit